LERDSQLRWGGCECGIELGGRYTGIDEVAAVEALGELPNRGVTPRPHLGQDAAHCDQGVVIGRRGAHERAGQIAATTEVESGEHGAVIVNRRLSEDVRIVPRHRLPRMTASSDFAELSSLRAQVDELTARVVAVG